ncbi:VWA domain-containing protein [Novipirellula rosea]|uniref:VWA domain-containing protein n=1 Tax=Novipirellula rosea TaxID=1031540 RepID=A0ABP8NTH3_9BACT
MADSNSHDDHSPATSEATPPNEDAAPETLAQRQSRWRLVMGSGSEQLCGALSHQEQLQEECLGFLYDREGRGKNVRGKDGNRSGSLDASSLTVPEWINQIHELFPKSTIERLEKDALERYQLDEMVTNPDVLARAQPNQTLLKAVLRTKHLMNQDVLKAAQQLVRKAVEQLMEEMAEQVRSAFQGSVDRRHRSFLRIAKNFDVQTTLRRNLKHYDPVERRVLVETPYFYSRVRRQVDRWQIIILVDESGSMLDSVIHSAVTAAVFYIMQMMKVHLCIFDTSVVDLTGQILDPVETLMKVQLGGGTDIGQAVAYASTLVENPQRTIVALITDFYEGGPTGRLYSAARQLVESGVTCLGLAALDGQADPTYDEQVAAQMVKIGWHVAAMTPGELANWVAEKVRA